MHLDSITIHRDRFPDVDAYPFNLEVMRSTGSIAFDAPVTCFVGENGTGKSTLLEAITRKCGIYIWGEIERPRYDKNPWAGAMYRMIDVAWTNGTVPGSYFSSQIFRNYARIVDEWATADPDMLAHYGGKSLVSQSHGQSLMSYFRNRYKIRGVYFLDEPETALSPRSQAELLDILAEMGADGHAQFIIATHSPILLACPGATIYSFDTAPVSRVVYEDCEHVRLYRKYLAMR